MRWCRKVALDTEGGEIRSIFFREYFCRLMTEKVFPETADRLLPNDLRPPTVSHVPAETLIICNGPSSRTAVSSRPHTHPVSIINRFRLCTNPRADQ